MKKISIIILCIIITIVLFFKLYLNVVFYSKFEEVKNVPQNVAKYFSSFRIEELYGIMEENKIEIRYNPYGKNGKYELIKFKNIHPFKDIVHPQFIDDKYFVCVSGPFTLESGIIRLFLYPNYSNLLIFNVDNLDIVAHYRIDGVIKKSFIDNSTIYFKLKNGKNGELPLGILK